MRGYYFITDAGLSLAGIIIDVKNAIQAGVEVVQYRNKTGTTAELYNEAAALRGLCKRTHLLINDRIDIALAVGADGIHLGQEDMPVREARRLIGPKKIIGLTVHSLQEAKEAQKQGVDYIGVSPIFATATKLDAGEPAGVLLIKKIKKEVTLPLVVIGGITLKNAPQVIAAGADAVCAISAVITKKDVQSEILKFQKLFSF
ncbi:MAG: thiamine phosphate synthase [bacterium]|nr:thiamine phosphate synthase [bacterium]MDD5354157.1 thiamine phosphate synthase [bacterium]MDD5755826.1 thiamine phosphate synthase [bacterium]